MAYLQTALTMERPGGWIRAFVDLGPPMASLIRRLLEHRPTLPNTPMAWRMQQYLESVGIPKYSGEEIAFAKPLQKNAGLEPVGMADRIVPLPDGVPVGGSSDIGDVSWITPIAPHKATAKDSSRRCL